ncbi:sugar kinase domain protein [Mycobacterium avium subsp. avium 2285 (R)]|nr:sugar kinase domain protein [Mycobacterium avium subsp. avium 2285 (R)]
MLTLGLDIGGTKIAAALVDSSGTLVHTAVRPTPTRPPPTMCGMWCTP